MVNELVVMLIWLFGMISAIIVVLVAIAREGGR